MEMEDKIEAWYKENKETITVGGIRFLGYGGGGVLFAALLSNTVWLVAIGIIMLALALFWTAHVE